MNPEKTEVNNEENMPLFSKENISGRLEVMGSYMQTDTSASIKMSYSGSVVNPIATLKDGFGGVAQIINDDHCYVVCLKNPDGTYYPTTHLFKEVFNVLKDLPEPD